MKGSVTVLFAGQVCIAKAWHFSSVGIVLENILQMNYVELKLLH